MNSMYAKVQDRTSQDEEHEPTEGTQKYFTLLLHCKGDALIFIVK